MKIIKYPLRKNWEELLKRPVIDRVTLEAAVEAILLDVKRNGDTALKKYSNRFEGLEPDRFPVEDTEFCETEKCLSTQLKRAIQLAKSNIERFHSSQIEEIKKVEILEGVTCWRKSVGIEKVGLYIPGGSAPLFSSVLMLGIPAQIAGCKEIILCSPPEKTGKINASVLYTAQLLGIKKVYKVGGAQAIGAMAFGTETIPKVDKIFGPGNQYVTSAKQLVSKMGVAIDMPAGPSELAVWADGDCVPAFVAADLLSQAEHGTDSQVVLVSENEAVIKNILKEIETRVESLPRSMIAKKALESSMAILVNCEKDAVDLLNFYAPEHLIIACKESELLSEQVINAGSVFLGNYSCESAGDYASGTNHTLPTNGNAKAYSGVSLDSFVKKITFQKLSREGLKKIGNAIEVMAEAEGLMAHKEAVSIRLK